MIRLIAIPASSQPDLQLNLPSAAHEVLLHTAEIYRAPSYALPWTGYWSCRDDEVIGYGAFKSAPANGIVEIAYSTFPPHEGRGVATEIARQLVSIARTAAANIVVSAQTLPMEGASTRILRRIGFLLVGTSLHPDDGMVWNWRLLPGQQSQ